MINILENLWYGWFWNKLEPEITVSWMKPFCIFCCKKWPSECRRFCKVLWEVEIVQSFMETTDTGKRVDQHTGEFQKKTVHICDCDHTEKKLFPSHEPQTTEINFEVVHIYSWFCIEKIKHFLLILYGEKIGLKSWWQEIRMHRFLIQFHICIPHI